MIISKKLGIYKFPHKLPKNLRLRILANQEKLRKSENVIELNPSAKPYSQMENFVNTRKKSLKNRN